MCTAAFICLQARLVYPVPKTFLHAPAQCWSNDSMHSAPIKSVSDVPMFSLHSREWIRSATIKPWVTAGLVPAAMITHFQLAFNKTAFKLSRTSYTERLGRSIREGSIDLLPRASIVHYINEFRVFSLLPFDLCPNSRCWSRSLRIRRMFRSRQGHC